MKSESGFGLAMASPFHFGTESCYIFDFFLLAISLTTIFQYGRSSIFGKCNHYFLGTGQASCPTTWWCCPWTPQRPLPPSSWSRSSTSTAGTTPTKLLPPSPYYWNWLAFYRFFVDIFWLFLDCLDYTIMDYSRLDSLIGLQGQLDYRNLY